MIQVNMMNRQRENSFDMDQASSMPVELLTEKSGLLQESNMSVMHTLLSFCRTWYVCNGVVVI